MGYIFLWWLVVYVVVIVGGFVVLCFGWVWILLRFIILCNCDKGMMVESLLWCLVVVMFFVGVCGVIIFVGVFMLFLVFYDGLLFFVCDFVIFFVVGVIIFFFIFVSIGLFFLLEGLFMLFEFLR